MITNYRGNYQSVYTPTQLFFFFGEGRFRFSLPPQDLLHEKLNRKVQTGYFLCSLLQVVTYHSPRTCMQQNYHCSNVALSCLATGCQRAVFMDLSLVPLILISIVRLSVDRKSRMSRASGSLLGKLRCLQLYFLLAVF